MGFWENVKRFNERWNDLPRRGAIVLMVLLALCVFALYRKVRCQRALRDDAAVRRLYYQEHDERTRYIAQQVGRSSMAVNTVLLVVAAVIAGYFSVTVFVTLLAVAAVQGLVQLLLKGLCARRYTGEEE